VKPGPPPIPFPLKRLRGNAGHQRLDREPEPERGAQCPEAPAFVTGHAADEWYRVGKQLHRLSLLTVVDVMPFAAYCIAYGRWKAAEEALARIADDDPAMHGLIVRGADGNVRINPQVRIAHMAAEAMIRAAGEFGMTAAARSRISAGVCGPPDDGKFSGLFGSGH